MEQQRFYAAAKLLYHNKVIVKSKGVRLWEFEVDAKYNVQISEAKISCTCEYGSLHGVKKQLPCRHIIACICLLTRVWGPALKERWLDPVKKATDLYNDMSAEEKEKIKRVVNNG